MKNEKWLAICAIVIFQAACEKSTNTEELSSDNDKRIISNAFISSCSQSGAGRIRTDSVPAGTSAKGNIYIVDVMTYTQSGYLVGNVRSTITSDTLPSIKPILMLWDGKDSTGKDMPAGNYFFYYVFTDTVTKKSACDSSCVKIAR